MRVEAKGVLAEWLEKGGHVHLLEGPFEVDDAEVVRLEAECAFSHPDYNTEKRRAWAIYSEIGRAHV